MTVTLARLFTTTSGRRGTTAGAIATAASISAETALSIADALDAACGGILAAVGIAEPETQAAILALLFGLPEPRNGRTVTDKSLYLRFVGERVRDFRDVAGITQSRLDRDAKLTPASSARLERGEYDPSVYELNRIAGVLGVPITELLPQSSPG